MDGKDKLDELLVSYLLNELDSEEDVLVVEWLNSDEQNRIYLQELKGILNLVEMGQVMDKIDVEAEFNRFDQARQGIEQEPGFFTEAERFGNQIIKEVGLKRKTSIYKTVALTAVAACILLAIGLGWSILSKENPVQQTVVQKVEEKEKQEESDQGSVPVIKHLANHTGKVKRYELEDGTVVLLSTNSELSFLYPFESGKRHVQLTGKAEFTVVTNKLRPFTVFSRDVATTALGTRFTVTAYENSSNVLVRLFEGKVVVKSLVPNKMNKKDFHLFPGEELVYNRPKKKTNVWKDLFLA